MATDVLLNESNVTLHSQSATH